MSLISLHKHRYLCDGCGQGCFIIHEVSFSGNLGAEIKVNLCDTCIEELADKLNSYLMKTQLSER